MRYSWTIGINICAAVVIFTPSIPPTIRELMFYPNAAIVNIMASRALRELRLEMMKDNLQVFSFHLTEARGTNEPTGMGTLEFARPSNLQGVSSGEGYHSDGPKETPQAIDADLEMGMYPRNSSKDQTATTEERHG